MKVKGESEVAQSCPTLRNPMDCSLPGSSVHRIFQARVLEQSAIAFSDFLYSFLYFTFATIILWLFQAPPSKGFSRQKYWSGLPFPSPEDLPNPRIEPGSPAFQADALTSEPPGKPTPSRTNTPKRCHFHYRGLECKSMKSRNTRSNRQIWPWNTE